MSHVHDDGLASLKVRSRAARRFARAPAALGRPTSFVGTASPSADAAARFARFPASSRRTGSDVFFL
jgi:hypothetical protein